MTCRISFWGEKRQRGRSPPCVRVTSGGLCLERAGNLRPVDPVWAPVIAGIGGGVIGAGGQVVKDLVTSGQDRRRTMQAERRTAYIELVRRADALAYLVESQEQTNFLAPEVRQAQLVLREALAQVIFWAPPDTAGAAAVFVRSREQNPSARFGGHDPEREAFTRLAQRDVT